MSRLEGIVGAQAVPKGLAVSLAILSALLIAQDLWRARRAAGAVAVEADEVSGSYAHLRALGMLLIGVGYLALVGTIGYVPAVALLVVATALYLGQSLVGQARGPGGRPCPSLLPDLRPPARDSAAAWDLARGVAGLAG